MKFANWKTSAWLLGAFSAAAAAHHSFTALYFVDEEVRIEGRVVQFAVRNPHSFLHVSAPDADGTEQRWAIEWGGVASLGRINRETLKPGDEVVVVGNPSRDAAAHRLRMVSIERPADGWSWGGTFD
jgi:hypothetical protein